MKTKFSKITLSLLLFSTFIQAVENNGSVDSSKTIAAEKKISSLLDNMNTVSDTLNLDVDAYTDDKQSLAQKKETQLKIGYGMAKPTENDISEDTSSLALGLGCEGITYNGAIEQYAIGYSELLRDTLFSFVDPYVCASKEPSLLEKSAFIYSSSICLAEMTSLLTTGSDLNGKQISGDNISTLSSECSGRIMKGTDMSADIQGNFGKMAAGGGGGIGLDGAFDYMKCVFEGLGKLGLSRYLDDCMDTNRNDFMEFIKSASDIDFSTDIAVNKFRIKECDAKLEAGGDLLDTKFGIFDLFKQTDVDGKKLPSIQNLNGVTINRQSKKLGVAENTMNFEIRKTMGFNGSTTDEIKEKVKSQVTAQWLKHMEKHKLILEQKYDKKADMCIKETGTKLSSVLGEVLSQPNLGIFNLIFLRNKLPFNSKFYYQYLDARLGASCKVITIKEKKDLLYEYNSIIDGWIEKYFSIAISELTNIEKIQADPSNTRNSAISEKYLQNFSTGTMNMEIEKFNMELLKKASDANLKSQILKFVYTKDKE